MTHTLVIESLHDLQARCTCGHWRIVQATPDDQFDDTTREEAREHFREHLVGALSNDKLLWKRIVYSICAGDIQAIAAELLGRALTEDELDEVADVAFDSFDWDEQVRIALQVFEDRRRPPPQRSSLIDSVIAARKE